MQKQTNIHSFQTLFSTDHPLLTADTSIKSLMDVKEAIDVLDRIRDGFFSVNKNWSITDVNSATLAMLRLTKKEIIGHSISDVFTSEDRWTFIEHYEKVIKTKKPVHFVAPYNNIFFSVHAHPTNNGGVAIFFRNITTYMKMKAALVEKEEFNNILSYELRTSLTALRLRVEMAKRKIEKDGTQTLADAEKVLKGSHQDILRINRLVDEMHHLSRLKHGKMTLDLVYFNLEDFFQEILDKSQNMFPNFAELVTYTINTPIMVKWDKSRINQVILNLINNAFRYGNGTPIQMDAHTGGGYVFITVKNGGPGISKEEQGRILKKFERGVDQTGKPTVGLYMSHEIVCLHQGTIKIHSLPGKGATFELRIPVTPI